MYFSSSCYAYATRDNVIKNEFEFEEIRLKKLLDDSITKVEKENWEIIVQETQNEQDFNSKPVNVAKRKQTVLKTSGSRKVKLKETALHAKSDSFATNKKAAEEEKSSEQNTSCQRIDRKNSAVHFLNHLESSLKSTKIDLRKKLASKSKYLQSIPLATPSQTHGPFYIEKLQKSRKPNTSVHQIKSTENYKNLTIQTLPSISIFEQKAQRPRNISSEVIKSDDLRSDNYKPLPLQPSNSSGINKSFKLNERSSPFKTTVHKLPDHRTSVFTSSTNEDHFTNHCCIDKESVKSVVKEVLDDYQMSPNRTNLDLEKLDSWLASKIENAIQLQTSQNKECHCAHQEKEIKNRKLVQSLNSSYSQTDCEKASYNSTSLKDIIREVLSEYQVFFTSMLEIKNKVEGSASFCQIPKENKQIQTDMFKLEKAMVEGNIPKEIQNASHHNPFSNSSSVALLQSHSNEIQGVGTEPNEFKQIKDAVMSSNNEKNTDNITAKQISDLTLKIENLTNVVSNHLHETNNAVKTGTLQEIESTKTISTRDVSLQFSPYLITRSSHTSPTRTTEKANQCETIAESKNTDVSDVAAQTSSKDISVNSFVDQSIQCEQPVIQTNSCWTQTKEFRQTMQMSDHSNTTSVSSTPVSDSLFLDDVISEGEVPWHLQLQSSHDNSAFHSSSNAAESSVAEDKDYSLSEGEIPPKYFPSWNNLHSLCNSQAECDKNSSSVMFKDEKRQDGKISSFNLQNFETHKGKKQFVQLSPGEIPTFSQNYVLTQPKSAEPMNQSKPVASNLNSSNDFEDYLSSGEVSRNNQISHIYPAHSYDTMQETSSDKQIEARLASCTCQSRVISNQFVDGQNTSEEFLKPQSSFKYNSLSNINYGEETLEDALCILQSTPRESLD